MAGHRFDASLADGGQLPNWLRFDAETAKLTGKAPDDFEGVLQIRLTARDNSGTEVTSEFTIRVSGSQLQVVTSPGQSVEQTVEPSPASDVDAQAEAQAQPGADTESEGASEAAEGQELQAAAIIAGEVKPIAVIRGAARFADQLRAVREQSGGKSGQVLVSKALAVEQGKKNVEKRGV